MTSPNRPTAPTASPVIAASLARCPDAKAILKPQPGLADWKHMVARLMAWLRCALADARGFTLIETLLASVMLIVVVGAILTAAESGQRVVAKDEALAVSLADSQVALDRMTRELRQTVSFNSKTATSIDANVRVRGTTTAGVAAVRVVYDCGVAVSGEPGIERCVRVQYTSGGVAGPQVPIVPRVRTADFTYEPNSTSPTYVRMTLKVPSRDGRSKGYDHDISLDDGFYMRNFDNG